MLLRLVTTHGRIETVSEHEVATATEARRLVDACATKCGMTNVRQVDSRDVDNIRYTATTSGGRAGRNIAFLVF